MTFALRSMMIVLVAAGLAACSNSSQRVRSLPAAPAQPVQTAALQPPLQPVGQPPLIDDPLLQDQPEEVAVVAPPPPGAGVEVGRTDLIGGWAVSSGGDSCQLFMSLTQWEGGYRASTRGCSNPSLSSISAWELNGNQVQLKGDAGAPVATLAADDATRFNGATTTGDAITVQR